jgi:hypothetical protein
MPVFSSRLPFFKTPMAKAQQGSAKTAAKKRRV